jgi:hypothetical protein
MFGFRPKAPSMRSLIAMAWSSAAADRKRELREFVETLVRLETDSARYGNRQGHLEIADRFADETSLLAYRKRIGDTGITWTWKALTDRFLEYQKPKLNVNSTTADLEARRPRTSSRADRTNERIVGGVSQV